MLINDKSTVVLINNVDLDAVRISRIKLENMFGKEKVKGKYITIWNNNCPTGTYPTMYNVKEGFSSDLIHANVFMTKYTGEIIVNGVELYVNVICDEFEKRQESDFVTFEQAIKSCLKETEY